MPLRLYEPHTKDLGHGLTVRRLLPGPPLAGAARFVGPFVFLDHVGPARFASGTGMDVRPHPHIGLATVTYLFDGAIVHRDSLGTVQRIAPGDVNWMVAGRGIVHSERTAPDERDGRLTVHGLQTWVALPREYEDAEPSFTHVPAARLPTIELPGVGLRVVAGDFLGRTAPTPVRSGTLYVAVDADAGATFEIPADHEERAVYVVSGGARIDGEPVDAERLARIEGDRATTVECPVRATLMLVGGDRLDGERHLWWNFVASDRQAIEEAKSRWRAQSMGQVPGETEFIPLPGDER